MSTTNDDFMKSIDALGKATPLTKLVDRLAGDGDDHDPAGRYAQERAEATLPLDLPRMAPPAKAMDKRAIMAALDFIRSEIEKSC